MLRHKTFIICCRGQGLGGVHGAVSNVVLSWPIADTVPSLQSAASLTDAVPVPVLKHHAIVACGIGYWILASTSYPEKAILHFRLHLPI